MSKLCTWCYFVRDGWGFFECTIIPPHQYPAYRNCLKHGDAVSTKQVYCVCVDLCDRCYLRLKDITSLFVIPEQGEDTDPSVVPLSYLVTSNTDRWLRLRNYKIIDKEKIIFLYLSSRTWPRDTNINLGEYLRVDSSEKLNRYMCSCVSCIWQDRLVLSVFKFRLSSFILINSLIISAL